MTQKSRRPPCPLKARAPIQLVAVVARRGDLVRGEKADFRGRPLSDFDASAGTDGKGSWGGGSAVHASHAVRLLGSSISFSAGTTECVVSSSTVAEHR